MRQYASALALLVGSARPGLTLKTSFAAGEKGACACLNFKSVYKQNLTTCGEGYELTSASAGLGQPKHWSELPTDRYWELCTSFYKEYDESACTNTDSRTGSKQWCYVSPACDYSDSFAIPNSPAVKGKICSKEHGDDVLADKTPEELNAIASKLDVWLDLLAHMAYPIASEKFSVVKSYLLGEQKSDAQMPQLLQDVIASGRTTLFEWANGDGSALVTGTKVHQFIHNEHWYRDHPKDYSGVEFVCAAGCGK